MRLLTLCALETCERLRIVLPDDCIVAARSTKNVRSLFSATTAAAVLLAGCAAPSAYMGISLLPGAAAADVQEQARQAQNGDKGSQLSLGVRFEEGRGLPADLKRARRLYKLAARDDSRRVWIYSPSPGGNAPARLIPIERQRTLGIVEAKRRLDLMRSKER